MTVHRLGVSQEEFEALFEVPRDEEVDISLDEGSSQQRVVDTVDVRPRVRLDVHHLDVGQGESTVLTVTADAHVVFCAVVDGGLETDGGSVLVRLLHRLGVDYIDAAIISHFDEDHFAGLMRVMRHLEAFDDDDNLRQQINGGNDGWRPIRIQKVFVRKNPAPDDVGNVVVKQTGAVKDLSALLASGNVIGTELVAAGDEIVLECDADEVGGSKLFKMTCVAANRAGDSKNDDEENANSLAWVVRFGRYSYYTAGDLPSSLKGEAQEDAIAARVRELAGGALTAIKCGHHGAETSTSKSFLDATTPTLAFISAGKQERFAHPRTSTLLRLYEQGEVGCVVLTNCRYNRPFVNVDYLSVAFSNVKTSVSAFLLELATLLVKIRDIPPDRGANGSAQFNLPILRELRATLVSEVKNRLEVVKRTFSNTAEPEIDDGVFEEVRAVSSTFDETFKKGDTQTWKVLGACSRGISLKGGEIFTLTVDAKTDIDPMAQTLRAAAVLAREVLDTRRALKTDRKKPVHFLVGGDRKHLGHNVFRMEAADAQSEGRVAFLGMFHGQWRWFPLGFGNAALDNVAPPTDDFTSYVEIEALKKLVVPGSPSREDKTTKRTFAELTEDRSLNYAGIEQYNSNFDHVFTAHRDRRRRVDDAPPEVPQGGGEQNQGHLPPVENVDHAPREGNVENVEPMVDDDL